MLEVKHISKKYKGRQILSDISFSAAPGECVAIAGVNGCGKTTLLSILAGICRPDHGEVLFFGKKAAGRRDFEQNSAYVPQENPFIPELSAGDNLRLWFKGNKRAMLQDLEKGTGARLAIGSFLDVPAGKLSGGQKKRLSITSALSGKARVLILDEPGAALDLKAKEEIIEYVHEFTAGGGICIITSHELGELRAADRVLILKNGSLIPYDGSLDTDEFIRSL